MNENNFVPPDAADKITFTPPRKSRRSSDARTFFLTTIRNVVVGMMPCGLVVGLIVIMPEMDELIGKIMAVIVTPFALTAAMLLIVLPIAAIIYAVRTGKTGAVTEYIAQYPPNVQAKLTELRDLIRDTLNDSADSAEGVTNGALVYKIYGAPLCYYAYFGDCIGFQIAPTPKNIFKAMQTKFVPDAQMLRLSLTKPWETESIRSMIARKQISLAELINSSMN